MKHILLLFITTLVLSRFAAASNNSGTNESEPQTYLKLYTTVTGTADNRQEKWLLANNGTRRIMATIEIVRTADDGKASEETKNVIVESGVSVQLGMRSSNGTTPNSVVILKAVFTPTV